MKFRINVNISENKGFFNHQSNILTIGSCFANHIYQRLDEQGFEIQSNPFGILFNPVSIEKNIRNSFLGNINEVGIVERNDLFFHYDCHSEIYTDSREGLIKQLSNIQEGFSVTFQGVNRLIITFGTAWVYRHLNTNQIVANCHKMPQKEFKKELLDLDALKTTYNRLLIDLKNKNPKLEILFTISPVRHIKNGVHENNLSKSILLLLVNALVEQFEFAHYFPSYELVMDDLRDYRFFEADLIHPNKQAVDYVFERFQVTYFDEKTAEIGSLAMKINQFENHRTLHPTIVAEEKRKLKLGEMRAQLEKLKS
ncbi:GSCFA domain-containing protein [Crocinitomix sp.]|nr:GSCFA domain-containing protein [Crocinitomix sp.]